MKRLFSLILALVLVCGLIPTTLAASAPAISSNLDYHWYVNGQRWAAPVYSNLAYENNQYVRVEGIGSDLVVEYYDKDFQFRSGKTIPLELPIYGGVYMDHDYNFLVVGQENHEENNNKEVFRIIRYTKDWKKVDHASIYGANTTVPFDAGSCRFDRSGNILYIRTCHEMYTTPDGVNHQANVMIAVRISDMVVTDELTRALNNNYGYASHSFNQFVRVDGSTLLAVDHGDFYPRSVALFKYSKKAGAEKFYGKTTMVNVLPIVESTDHYNDTGVSVGGFEFSSSSYLVAGSSYHQKESTDLFDSNVHRNIFVTVTPKDNFTDKATKIHWITNYEESDGVSVSPPHLVKVGSNRFFLTWTENDVMKYCFLNGHGEPEGPVRTSTYHLSDCAPIVVGENIVWYVTDFSAPDFYQVPIHGFAHSYSTVLTLDPTCTEPGSATHTCVICAHSYTEVIPALGHNWQGTECFRCGLTRKTIFDDVVPGSFYEEPVAWALKGGITSGISANLFGSNNDCNRAQVVTFLWRTAGQPEPVNTHNPFVDVNESDFFYKPVLWAVEKGITNGQDATHFGPNVSCNRAQVVTFLWRAQNSPAASAANSFADVEAGAWYEAPINWAVENTITSGLSATQFGVNTVCNRAQIVTFLYRTFS